MNTIQRIFIYHQQCSHSVAPATVPLKIHPPLETCTRTQNAAALFVKANNRNHPDSTSRKLVKVIIMAHPTAGILCHCSKTVTELKKVGQLSSRTH